VAPAALRQTPTTVRPRNVIVYLVDTLRADHLGCYGYQRPVSPRIDAFAGVATRFRHTVAQSSWTRPAVTTILTGLLPRTHDVHGRRDALSQEAVTLAEILKERGYRTAAFVTNGNVAKSFGLGQGFETYQLLPGKHNSAAEVNVEAAEWLDGRRTDAPFFLYLHTVEPHGPYSPPAPFRQRFAAGVRGEDLTTRRTLRALREGTLRPTPQLRRDLLDLYDGEIAANDAAFGELMDLLVRRALWEETVVVFLSDHGEEFLDHGSWEHGATLHAEMLEVPLIVRVPGMGTGDVVDRLAQHADVAPTILDVLELPVPAAMEGRSLLPWIAGDGLPAEGEEEEVYSWLNQREFKAAAVTTPAWRLIENQTPVAGRHLYDRKSDPAERKNLVSQRPVRWGYLRTRLRAEERPREGSLQAGQGTADTEVRKQLQALGYVR
jgi:arylsulfatase A-like enzyme